MKQRHATERRRFLQGVAVTGGATVLTGVLASDLLARDPAATTASKNRQPESRGYRETGHIREYYRTLRL